MNSLRTWIALFTLTLSFVWRGPCAQAQSEKPAGESTQGASATASKAEVEELSKELAGQRRTIERLQTLVEQLADIKSRAPAPATDGAHLVNASLALPATVAEMEVEALPEPYQKPPEKKDSALPVTAGWNGEHFFIKSADAAFQIQPYGYVQTDYRSYKADGAPADTFSVRRGRFGFQANYGTHFQFVLLFHPPTHATTILPIHLHSQYI